MLLDSDQEAQHFKKYFDELSFVSDNQSIIKTKPKSPKVPLKTVIPILEGEKYSLLRFSSADKTEFEQIIERTN